jgi:hypothetical protein
MGRRVRTGTELDEARWCGRLEWQITTATGGYLGLLEFKVGYDDVAVFFAGRNLGRTERRALHGWFLRPVDPFRMDDVLFALRGRTLMMALDASPPFPVPHRQAAQILAVV